LSSALFRAFFVKAYRRGLPSRGGCGSSALRSGTPDLPTQGWGRARGSSPARMTMRPSVWNPQELLARGLVGALRRTAARAPPGFWAHAGRPPLASAAFLHWRALLWRPAHPPACGRRAGPRARKPRAQVQS